MNYLNTQAGYLAEHAIVLIEKCQMRGKKLQHKIYYTHGSEPRETWATDDDVTEFLD